MTTVALVFRTIGERTSELALELAKQHVQPEETYVLANHRPFTDTVKRMVELDFGTDQVVTVDADSLILEDLRPWLEKNREPYVDCYVSDRFRGRIHCGVHITRIDVMRAMREVTPPVDEEAYVLRPESRLRKLALNKLGHQKSFKGFRILHDHAQHLRDVWAKYALRELRSRTPEQRRKLDAALASWKDGEVVELRVAEEAVRWAQRELPPGTPSSVLSSVIATLPETGAAELARLGIAERGPLTMDEVVQLSDDYDRSFPRWDPRFRVFGIGLSRTGTRSLTAALHVLGVDTIHYPIDEGTLRALTSGRLDFGVLDAFDGITDITVAPYYAELARRHPDARFVLTVRDEEAWLRSCERHWTGRDAFADAPTPAAESHMNIRRFLRAAVYGTYDFEPERFRLVYRRHIEAVRRHFASEPGRLLELDIAGGDGWKTLAPFLGRPIPEQPFPHKGGALSARLAAEIDDPDD
jgi:hypothetical protein